MLRKQWFQYASSKAKSHFGFNGEDWELRTIANFNSILNVWVDSVPEHCAYVLYLPTLTLNSVSVTVRWDPTREDGVFFLQSAHLYAQFYDLQIMIHRPFITRCKPSPRSFPSVAVCANAARSCVHVIDGVTHRWPGRTVPFLMARPFTFCPVRGCHADVNVQRPAFMSVIVLLFGAWNARSSNIAINVEQEMVDVYKCLSFLQDLEPHWNPAGRIVDILSKLTTIGETPLPQAELRAKRPRERAKAAATPDTLAPSSSTPSSDGTSVSHAPLPAERPITGSSRVRVASASRMRAERMGSYMAGGVDGVFMESMKGETAWSMAEYVGDGDTSPLRGSELEHMDADHPLLWDPNTFSFAVPFAPRASSWQSDVRPLDSMFFQTPEALGPALGTDTQFAQDLPTSNVDFGALFGFGGGAPPPTALPPQMEFVFGKSPPAPGSTEELLQGYGVVPDGGGMTFDVRTGVPTEYVNLVDSWL
jgi:hypothetical protein